MREENVIFENQGEKLSGVLHTPDAEAKSAIIICHGFAGDKNGFRNKYIRAAKKLAANGFAVLRFDFRGCGGSDGKFVDMTIAGEVDDFRKAIDFLQGLGYKKIGVIGGSFGGFVCVLANDPRVKAMTLWAPSLDLKELFFKKGRITSEMVNEALVKGYTKYKRFSDGTEVDLGKDIIQEIKTVEIFDKKKTACPLLIVHGNKDDIVDYRYSEKYIRYTAGQKQLKIIPGADHNFSIIPEHEQQLMEATIEWLNKWLK
jgi:hypothetical protein